MFRACQRGRSRNRRPSLRYDRTFSPKSCPGAKRRISAVAGSSPSATRSSATPSPEAAPQSGGHGVRARRVTLHESELPSELQAGRLGRATTSEAGRVRGAARRPSIEEPGAAGRIRQRLDRHDHDAGGRGVARAPQIERHRTRCDTENRRCGQLKGGSCQQGVTQSGRAKPGLTTLRADVRPPRRTIRTSTKWGTSR